MRYETRRKQRARVAAARAIDEDVAMHREPQRPGDERRLAELAHALIDGVAAIHGRAQFVRRRVGRVDRLSREHIAADMARIERDAARLVGLAWRLNPRLGDPAGPDRLPDFSSPTSRSEPPTSPGPPAMTNRGVERRDGAG